MRWEFLLKLYGEYAVTLTKQRRKKQYIHATEPGMRKLEASIIREKHERR